MKPNINNGKQDTSPLTEYVKGLPDSEKELIKTIPLNNIDYLLTLDHEQFRDLIANSLSLEELGQLPGKQLERRSELINEIKKIRSRLFIQKWGEGQQQQKKQKQKKSKKQSQKQQSDRLGIIERVSEDIMDSHRLITIEENRDILYYNHGVYISGGDILIEKESENMCGYKLSNRDLTEIKGHIMRKTYRKRTEIDADINIINLKNGLYNHETGEFKEHTPDYLSVNQKPILYDPKAKPKLLGRFLREVLYPNEIRTALELMAYTFYRDNPYELYCILLGIGANGKSVLTSLLTALHEPKNISNVPFISLLDNRFALADLENKDVNIDTELSSATVKDTAILKKLTGSKQPVRIERKNQRAYDTNLHAKLFFNANKIPPTDDNSDAHFRRQIIISFPINLKET